MRRLISIFLLGLTISASAQTDILEKRFSISFMDLTLRDALFQLQSETDIILAYNEADNDMKTLVTSDFLNKSLEVILSEMLRATSLKFQKLDQQIIIYSVAKDIYSQNLRGFVFDEQSKIPLVGATIRIVEHSKAIKGTTTNLKGEFLIEKLSLKRYNIEVSFVGYQRKVISDVLFTAGKETFINIGMTESIGKLDEVIITAEHQKDSPINDMALISARTFSIDEASRFAGSFDDPARMALAYAGVRGGDDDIRNEIIVRGNSPKGLLWRLEGIEVPNPNHFSDGLPSGGAVSLLSSNVLDNSDFFTGAFPAEYGNALSGIFDINFRRGNNRKREYALQAGVLGLEASMEGPIFNDHGGSYLINYRYSTLALIGGLIDAQNSMYQDLAYNISLPTQKLGKWSLFGLTGNSSENEDEQFAFSPIGFYLPSEVQSRLSVYGIKNLLPISSSTFIKSMIVASHRENTVSTNNPGIMGDPNDLTAPPQVGLINEKNTSKDKTLRATIELNSKISSKMMVKIGLINGWLGYDFNAFVQNELINIGTSLIDQSGSTQLSQTYVSFKNHLSKSLEWVAGIHASSSHLNNDWVFEPRFSFKWHITDLMSFSAAYGRHSKMESLGLYLSEVETNGDITLPNKQLGLTKADHYVLGYQLKLSQYVNLSIEVYKQKIFDIPSDNHVISSINFMGNELIDQPLFSNGIGNNKGIDITLERYLNKGYYYLASYSRYTSTFKINGLEYSTRYNGKYNSSLLIGREIAFKKSTNSLTIGTKFIGNGGRPITPLLLEESLNRRTIVEDMTQHYKERAKAYMRLDFQISYRINSKRLTHTLKLDIQNTTNRKNQLERFYNTQTESIDWRVQNGILPVFSYKIEF